MEHLKTFEILLVRFPLVFIFPQNVFLESSRWFIIVRGRRYYCISNIFHVWDEVYAIIRFALDKYKSFFSVVKEIGRAW